MQIRASIRQLGNTFSPDLQKKVLAITGAGRTALLQKIGLSLVSISKRSFATDRGLRPLPWHLKTNGMATDLQKSTALRQSVRVVGAGGVTIGSDRLYAAIHQLGGKTPPHIIRPKNKKALKFGGTFAKKVNHPGSRIPSRPYMPFYRDGSITERAARNVESLIRRAIADPR
ncbi:MAG: phage virion morphogenesis protein [Verrucomicrobiota bacterium]